MTEITENEFARICDGICTDRVAIVKHNPIGSDAEILLWMLLNCLNSYLSLPDKEAPCFAGVPDEATYREAVLFVLRGRRAGNFDPRQYIDKLIQHDC